MAGRDTSVASFTILPIHRPLIGKRDGYSSVTILPVEFGFMHNSENRHGNNLGNRIPGKGLGTYLSGGFYYDDGRVSVQFKPELVTAELDSFQTFPVEYDVYFWRIYFEHVLNNIDTPERLGYKPTQKLLPGQSSIRFHWKDVSIGASTEHLWWGPGIRNSLLMTNNAPGFLHVTLNTKKPIATPVGRFEAQYIIGKLENSKLDPRNEDTAGLSRFFFRKRPDDHRVLMGYVLAWQPKWTPGLTLGTAVTDMAYSRSMRGWTDYLSPFQPHRRQPFGFTVDPFEEDVRDRKASFFFRYVQPESGVEVYGEYGREEMAKSPADFLEIPEHTRAYVIGAQKQLPFYFGLDVLIHAEMTQTEFTATRSFRPSPSWYSHHVVRHGYTNKGQVIGSGVGPGGSSQFLNIAFLNKRHRIGFFGERAVRNNDYYYTLFATTFERHWVDLMAGVEVKTSWRWIQVYGEARYIRAYNYQYQEASIPGIRYIGVDVTNIYTSGGVRILL